MRKDEPSALIGEAAAAGRERTRYDVFLSHNSRDKPFVERLAERLKRAGIEPWLDAWVLAPGDDWQRGIADGIAHSTSCAVFIGGDELGAWEQMEMQIAADRHVHDRDGFRAFLVLLPEAPDQLDAQRLPPVLRMRTWVDYRDGLDDERAFRSFVSAVNGLPLGPSVPMAPVDDVCPYRGLDLFDEEHSEFFFGRDGDVQRLREKLKGGRFLAVLGASGSGKSSLVRAGLLPGCRRDGWEAAVLRPGGRPLESLAARLLRLGSSDGMQRTLDLLRDDERTLHLASSLLLADRPEGERLLLVVDQFEEVFTLCRDEGERRAFFANLLYASSYPGGAASVVLTMRADFYHRCGAYPELAQTLASQQYLVSPLEREGLRQAIEEPARLVGLAFEPGLTQTILDDVAGQPGVLPLLEHALLELWQRRRGGMLTLAGYQETGGVQGAIAKRADEIFDAFTPEQQELARRMFLRLTQPGEGTEDTRRRAPLAELASSESDNLDVLLRALVDARLLTTSHDDTLHGEVVEVAHEALIRGWPHLRAWIEEDRAGLRLHRRLTEAAQEWERLRRDAGALHRGARLAQSLEWRAAHEDELNTREREFLDASAAAERNELAEIRHRARRLRRLALALAVVGLAAVAVAVFAFLQRADANHQKQGVSLASLAAAANSQHAHLDTALLLALAAASRHSAQSDGSMVTALERARERNTAAILHDDNAVANGIAWSPRAHVLATASANGTVRLWNVAKRERLGVLRGDGGYLNAVAFDPRGGIVAAGGRGGVFLWSLSSGHLLAGLRGPAGAVTTIAYRPDGAALVAGTDAGEIWRWSTRTRAGALRQSDGQSISSVAVAGDGTIAFADGGPTAFVLRPDAASPVALSPVPGKVRAVAFSPDGETLAIAGGTNKKNGARAGWVQSRDVHSLKPRAMAHPGPDGPSDFIETLSFDSHASMLAAAGPDGSVWLWDLASPRFVSRFGADAGHLHSVAFDPATANTVAVAANDGEVLVWRPGQPTFGHWVTGIDAQRERVTGSGAGAIVLAGPHARRVTGAGLVTLSAVSDKGDWLAAADPDGSVRVWPTASGGVVARIGTGTITALAIDDRGRTLATGYASGAVRLWDVATRHALEPVLRGQSDKIKAVAFSPDGRLLASGGADAATYLWDVRKRRKLAALRLGLSVGSLAFSSDGRLLATGQDDGIRLWDTRAHVALGDAFGVGGTTELAFTSDGHALVSRGPSKEGHVWNGILWSSDDDLHSQVCSLVYPGLTRDEWRELAPQLKYRPTCP